MECPVCCEESHVLFSCKRCKKQALCHRCFLNQKKFKCAVLCVVTRDQDIYGDSPPTVNNYVFESNDIEKSSLALLRWNHSFAERGHHLFIDLKLSIAL